LGELLRLGGLIPFAAGIFKRDGSAIELGDGNRRRVESLVSSSERRASLWQAQLNPFVY
jgi:hypothetical protein